MTFGAVAGKPLSACWPIWARLLLTAADPLEHAAELLTRAAWECARVTAARLLKPRTLLTGAVTRAVEFPPIAKTATTDACESTVPGACWALSGGSARFRVAPGRSVRLKLRLTAAGAGRVTRARGLACTATALATDGLKRHATTKAKIPLRSSAARRRHP